MVSEKAADKPRKLWLNGWMVTTQLPQQVQDLALWLNARWVFDVPERELGELGDAMLAGVDDPQLDEIEARLVDRVWTTELERDVDEALVELAGEADGCGHTRYRHTLERARVDLEVRHHGSAIARALLRQVAYQAAQDRLPFMFCLCCLEERIQNRPDERRAAALETAPIAWPDVDIGDEELKRAARRGALDPGELPALLATDARRRVARARLRRLAGFAAQRQPQLSRELRKVLAEPLSPDPRNDALWVKLCRSLVDFELLPGFN